MADNETSDGALAAALAAQQMTEAQREQMQREQAAQQHAADAAELAAYAAIEGQRAKPELMKKRHDGTITREEARKLSEINAGEAARRQPTWRDETVPWRHEKEDEQG